MEDEGQYEKDMQPDDVVADEDMRYESDDNRELKLKEKPVSPPLDLVVPFNCRDMQSILGLMIDKANTT